MVEGESPRSKPYTCLGNFQFPPSTHPQQETLGSGIRQLPQQEASQLFSASLSGNPPTPEEGRAALSLP